MAGEILKYNFEKKKMKLETRISGLDVHIKETKKKIDKLAEKHKSVEVNAKIINQVYDEHSPKKELQEIPFEKRLLPRK